MLALVVVITQIKKTSPEAPENVVLIVADALRWDVLGCYGGKADTPNIDKLASRGVVFENAYSTAPCTMPSAIGMSTGNYSRTYAVVVNSKTSNPTRKLVHYVNDQEVLLAEEMQRNKVDVLMDIENPTASIANNFHGFTELRKKEQMLLEEITLVEEALGFSVKEQTGDSQNFSGYDQIYSMLHYILTVPESHPFFIMKWFMDPHSPYDPPDRFKKKIQVDPLSLVERKSFYSKSLVKDFNEVMLSRKLTGAEYAYIRDLYIAEVEYVDERVGLIVEALEKRGLLDTTLVVFTSDHGEFLGEYGGRLGHGHRYFEELVHVPLIYSGPGIPEKTHTNTIVTHLDLMPTLQDILNLTFNHGSQGRSYRPVFSNKRIENRIPYFDRVSNDMLIEQADSDALLMDGYKLIVQKEQGTQVFRLYDLKGSTGEKMDIAEENSSRVRAMFEQILSLRRENARRLQENLTKLDTDVDMQVHWEKTREQLKSLGYIK
jgi:arylsulfatase A-like enzyme